MVRDIVWHTPYFEPDDLVWIAEGTAYDEYDCLILVQFTIPAKDRITVLKGGTMVDYRKRAFKNKDLVRLKLSGAPLEESHS